MTSPPKDPTPRSAPTPISAKDDRRDPSRTRDVRAVFWQNVVQQVLTTFNQRAARRPELADGRMAVLTRGGERVAIKAVHPLFACTVHVSPMDRALSELVQCTVFEIHTPAGEVLTLPLEEIRGVHVLTEELAQELKAAAGEGGDAADDSEPFGYAAFTSLARRERRAEAEARAKDGAT